jgi:GT2 family glycosyltransferase
MKLIVIIATIGRRAQVGQLVRHLESQTRPPDEVIISAPDASHVETYDEDRFTVRHVFGAAGLTIQRNAALEVALGRRADVVTFFDDDFIPADNYLAEVAVAFRANPNWSVVMGRVVADGARGTELDWKAGLAALRSAVDHPTKPGVVEHVGAYGCNMSVRVSALGKLRFDERLPLYGWLEDIDFTSQLRRTGRVIELRHVLGVHLGVRSGGRVSGRRLGYSQVMNPIYLVSKGTVPFSFAMKLMVCNVIANLTRSLWPEAHVDRWGRLRGNFMAASHAILGRIEPEYILKIGCSRERAQGSPANTGPEACGRAGRPGS